MSRLIAIVAMTSDHIIGRNGTLPWHLPEDLAFFRKTTSGHTILMGRKTFDSIGKPLPKRRNLILTRNPDFSAKGTETLHHPHQLDHLTATNETVYLIGGAEIYSLFLPALDEILVTHVRQDYPGDTRFPAFEHAFQRAETVLETPDFQVVRYLRKPAPSPGSSPLPP